MNREVGEEAGWTIRDLKPFAFAHLRHTTPKPDNYSFLYPHFVWLIYTAQAVDFRPELMFTAEQLVEEYVIGSKFVPLEDALQIVSNRDKILLKALKR